MSLGPDARSLLAAADGADDPTSADEARIRAKIAARIAIAAGTGIAATTVAKTASAGAAGVGTAATTSLAAKIAIGVAVVSATTAGGAVVYERVTHEDRAPVTVATNAPPANANVRESRPTSSTVTSMGTATPTTLPEANEVPDPPAPTVTAHVAVTATPAPIAKPIPRAIAKPLATTSAPAVTDTIAEEASLLRTAHSALARGDGGAAMTSLDEHARRFPHGTLAEEREAARVLALCAQGRASEARASASAFVASNPRSPFAAQVRRSCASKND